MDADLRKPAIHEYFDLSPHTGLTNVLLNNCSLEEAILPTPIEHLELLPSGSILVVLSGKTKIAAVKKSKEVLEGTTGKLLGAMLNGKKVKKGRHYMY